MAMSGLLLSRGLQIFLSSGHDTSRAFGSASASRKLTLFFTAWVEGFRVSEMRTQVARIKEVYLSTIQVYDSLHCVPVRAHFRS